MSSSEQVREQIARVLFDAIDLNRAVLADCELIADALLARWPVLAGPTDEMVERAARAEHWHDFETGNAFLTWELMSVEARGFYLDEARRMLAAVLGSRDADAPGDGSAT